MTSRDDVRELMPDDEPLTDVEREALLQTLESARKAVVLPLLDVPPGLVERTVARAVASSSVRPDPTPWLARLDRWVSRLGALAMRPQAAMGMLLVLMVGSSLLFLRARPRGAESVSVRERGEPAEPVDTRAPAGAAPLPAPQAVAPALGFAEPSSAARDDAAYIAAMEDYKAKRWVEAIRRFDIVAQGGGPNAPFASLYAARATRFASGCGGALSRFETTASRYAGTGVALEASWDAAVCHREMGDLERARLLFANLRNTSAYRERAEREIAAIDQRRESLKASEAGAKVGGMATPRAAPSGNSAPSGF